MMEWEKMLEEYFAMLESFSGMALFEGAVRMEEEMAGWEAERMRQVGEEEVMRMDGGEGMEESWGAVFGGGMDWMKGDGVSVSGDAEMEEEVRRMERVAEMAAAVSREISGDGMEEERLESWWAEMSGEEEYWEADAGEGPDAAVYTTGGREPAGDALREAALRMLPEENGMVFRPAEPPEWRDAAEDRPVFLWQAAAGREAEPASDGGGERVVLFSGRREAETEPARGREEDGFADRILDELEARLMLEIGSGAEGYYK